MSGTIFIKLVPCNPVQSRVVPVFFQIILIAGLDENLRNVEWVHCLFLFPLVLGNM